MSLKPIMGDWYYSLEIHPSGPHYRNTTGQRTLGNPNFLARFLVDVMRPTYVYSTEHKKWFHFNESQWVKLNSVYDVTIGVLEEIREAFRARFLDDNLGDLTKKHYIGWDNLLSNNFVHSVISNIEATTKMYASDKDFDINQIVINTPNGLYDLATKQVVPQAASYMCRNMTAISPIDDDNGRLCPEYMKHLEFITHGNPDLMNYLEALSGYILTGETFQQEFYWFQGVPKTGKSALADIWVYILGSYSAIGYKRQFAEVHNEPHAEQDYRLIGKRLVYTDEPKINKWDGEKLKAFTGSTAVTGRPMYGEGIEFYPVCKILFSSNDKPEINGADDGVARRLRLIPFTRIVPESMRISKFAEIVLREEAPYILHRMMLASKQVLEMVDRNGRLQHRGLPKCQIIDEVSKAYMQDNDILRQFISDCCSTEHTDTETTKNLYRAFSIWCEENSYDCPAQNKFGRMLSAASYELSRTNSKRLRERIKLTDIWAKKIGLYQNAVNN